MYWYKVKNVLIVLFAFINLFLLGTIITNNIERKREEEKLNQSLVNILAQNNIKIEQDIIPSAAPDMRVTQVENCVSQDLDFACAIFGENAEYAYDSNGNAYYRAYGKKLYVHDGSMHYYNAAFSGVGDTDERTAESAKTALVSMGIDVSAYEAEMSGDIVVFTMCIDGKPLFGNTMNVKMFGNEIGELWGHIIKDTAYSGTIVSVRSAADVMLEFLQDSERGDSGTAVTDIVLGYSILEEGASIDFKTADAVPTYMIKTGDGKIFYYDARVN